MVWRARAQPRRFLIVTTTRAALRTTLKRPSTRVSLCMPSACLVLDVPHSCAALRHTYLHRRGVAHEDIAPFCARTFSETPSIQVQRWTSAHGCQGGVGRRGGGGCETTAVYDAQTTSLEHSVLFVQPAPPRTPVRHVLRPLHELCPLGRLNLR